MTKKIIYILMALLLVAGGAFVPSQTQAYYYDDCYDYMICDDLDYYEYDDYYYDDEYYYDEYYYDNYEYDGYYYEYDDYDRYDYDVYDNDTGDFTDDYESVRLVPNSTARQRTTYATYPRTSNYYVSDRTSKTDWSRDWNSAKKTFAYAAGQTQSSSGNSSSYTATRKPTYVQPTHTTAVNVPVVRHNVEPLTRVSQTVSHATQQTVVSSRVAVRDVAYAYPTPAPVYRPVVAQQPTVTVGTTAPTGGYINVASVPYTGTDDILYVFGVTAALVVSLSGAVALYFRRRPGYTNS